WAEDPRLECALSLGHRRARALLGEGLPQILRRQPYFLSELDQLRFRELLGRVGIRSAALQLGGAGQHPLESGAIEANGGYAWRVIGHTTSTYGRDHHEVVSDSAECRFNARTDGGQD